jgi:hypothetical protein
LGSFAQLQDNTAERSKKRETHIQPCRWPIEFVNADRVRSWASYTISQYSTHYERKVTIVYALTWGARYCLIWSYDYMPSMCSLLVDQNGTSNQWLSLGVYQFGGYPSAPWYGVWIDDKTGEAQAGRNQVGVDAVRFRSPWPVYIPIVLKN